MKKIFLFSILLFSNLFAQKHLEFTSMFYAFKNDGDDKNVLMSDNNPARKKAGLAVLYSILLPGMGELYADNYSSGKYFTIADAVLWGFVIGFNNYAVEMEDNYKSYAKSFGSANISGKDDNYFVNVGLYMNVDDYNKVKELERNYGDVYPREKYYWKWDSQTQRKEFRRMWKSSENAYNNIRFAAGALILNRIASAINAVRSVSRYNKNLQNENSWNINFDYENSIAFPSTIKMNFTTTF